MKRSVAMLSVFVLFSAACGDDRGGLVGPGGEEDGGLVADGGGSGRDGGSSGTDGGPQEARVLSYGGARPVLVQVGDTTDLVFTLRTVRGAPVRGETVTFSLNGSGGVLAVDRATTSVTGAATARFTAGSSSATLTLTAGASLADDLTVQIDVVPKAAGHLNVNVISNARINVTRADVSVYATPAGAAPPTCAVLAASNPLPFATHSGAVSPLPGAASFRDLPTGALVTAFARGVNARGDVVATGCAEGGTIAGGVTTSMSVALSQLPTVLAGEYDALLQMNIGNALPAPYDGYVNLVTRILSNPAGVASFYVLQQADQALGFGFLEWTPPNSGTSRPATLDEVMSNPAQFPVWTILTNTVDGWLTSALGQTYTDIRTVGGDLRSLVSEFEVGARFRLTGTSNPSQYAVNESWRAIVFTWRFGCPAGDLGCARRPLQLDNSNYAPVNVHYNAATSHEPLTGTLPQSERFKVVADAHNVPFSYGALVLIALQQIVFPSLTGCTDCHSIGDVLNHLIDCANIGTSIANAINNAVGANFVSPATATTYCTNALDGVGQFVEAAALNLTIGGNPTLGAKLEGLGGAGTFYLVDADQDLKTELVRDLQARLQWVYPNDPARTQDITAPITGRGREAASQCRSDASCAAAQSCQLVPSYLEVRGLETTCRKAVGAVAGRGACATDADCRSGVCLRTSSASAGQCFAACTQNAECGGATCDPQRAGVSLDPVRAGLGMAYGKGCAP
jgi:hypothetical protein